MPLVGASVCSIIAVPKVKYYRADSEAILLRLHYIKQMSSKLQKPGKKKKKAQAGSFESFYLYLSVRSVQNSWVEFISFISLALW